MDVDPERSPGMQVVLPPPPEVVTNQDATATGGMNTLFRFTVNSPVWQKCRQDVFPFTLTAAYAVP